MFSNKINLKNKKISNKKIDPEGQILFTFITFCMSDGKKLKQPNVKVFKT